MAARKTLSFTISEPLFTRLERYRRSRREVDRSSVIECALLHYLGLEGPDPAVVERWASVYVKAAGREAAGARAWSKAQSRALGAP